MEITLKIDVSDEQLNALLSLLCDKKEKDIGLSDELMEKLKTPIDNGFSVRVVNILRGLNIKTLYDLVKYTESNLIRCKGVGRTAIVEILQYLQNRGLSLGMLVDKIGEKKNGSRGDIKGKE